MLHPATPPQRLRLAEQIQQDFPRLLVLLSAILVYVILDRFVFPALGGSSATSMLVLAVIAMLMHWYWTALAQVQMANPWQYRQIRAFLRQQHYRECAPDQFCPTLPDWLQFRSQRIVIRQQYGELQIIGPCHLLNRLLRELE